MYINKSYKFHRIPDRQSRFITKAHDLLGQPCIFSILRFKFVISFVRSLGGTWYMYILASICDFCTYRIKCNFELSPTLTLPTCEQRRLCPDFVCAQVRKIYMKTELQCVLSRLSRLTYFIFHLPVSLRQDGPLQWRILEGVRSNPSLRQNYLIFIENFQKNQENC